MTPNALQTQGLGGRLPIQGALNHSRGSLDALAGILAGILAMLLYTGGAGTGWRYMAHCAAIHTPIQSRHHTSQQMQTRTEGFQAVFGSVPKKRPDLPSHLGPKAEGVLQTLLPVSVTFNGSVYQFRLL